MTGWYIRRYEPSDRQQVKSFACYTPAERWTKTPQKMIRSAPDSLDEPGVRLLVAPEIAYDWLRGRPRETGSLLGVSLYAIEGDQFVSHSLGVVRSRRREGIGWALKQAALADFLYENPEGGVEVLSHVHRKNIPMNALNRKLNASTIKDTEDGDLLITVVKIVPPEPHPPWHQPADLLGRFARAVVPGPWRRPAR